jgi:predicted transcriptional regulator
MATTQNVTVRMPSEVTEKLERIAERLDRSRNWVINEAIERYLDVYDWQMARIAERLDQAEHGGTFAPHDQVMARLEAKVKTWGGADSGCHACCAKVA